MTGSAREDKGRIEDMISQVFPEISFVRVTCVDCLLSIKVTLKKSEDALKILRSRNRFRPVTVRANLTLKQTEYLSQLRQELEKRKSKVEKYITIHYVRGTQSTRSDYSMKSDHLYA